MIPLAVAGVLSHANVGPLTVTRPGAPVKSDAGVWTDGAAFTFTIDPVACHTITGRDLEAVPEAYRSRDVRRFVAKVRLYVAGSGRPGDLITYGGDRFRVIVAHDYAENGAVWIYDAVREEG